jgi:hypothetical protein
MYLSFLQKLSKSNKIGFRASSLDIITECMLDEWLWGVTTDDSRISSRSGGNFYARSLLSMVSLRDSFIYYF